MWNNILTTQMVIRAAISESKIRGHPKDNLRTIIKLGPAEFGTEICTNYQ